MKRTNIYLEEELDRRLRHYAIEHKRSFTDVVRQALEEFAAREGIADDPHVIPPRNSIPADEWSARMESLLNAIHARMPQDIDPEEIEAEITAAQEEVRQARLARLEAASTHD